MGLGNGPLQLSEYVATLTSNFNNRLVVASHNPLLEVALDTGLLGALVYLTICVVTFWQFVRLHGRLNMRGTALAGYFPMVLCITAGYLMSWLKGGGLENNPTFFLLLALLVIPSQLSRDFYSTTNRSTDTLARAPQHSFNRLHLPDPHGPSLQAEDITWNEGK